MENIYIVWSEERDDDVSQLSKREAVKARRPEVTSTEFKFSHSLLA